MVPPPRRAVEFINRVFWVLRYPDAVKESFDSAIGFVFGSFPEKNGDALCIPLTPLHTLKQTNVVDFWLIPVVFDLGPLCCNISPLSPHAAARLKQETMTAAVPCGADLERAEWPTLVFFYQGHFATETHC